MGPIFWFYQFDHFNCKVIFTAESGLLRCQFVGFMSPVDVVSQFALRVLTCFPWQASGTAARRGGEKGAEGLRKFAGCKLLSE